ncbi:MAG: strawberry notch-like NTP hydrolase domain-containing protein [Thermodesulfobacteriota bacterium]
MAKPAPTRWDLPPGEAPVPFEALSPEEQRRSQEIYEGALRRLRLEEPVPERTVAGEFAAGVGRGALEVVKFPLQAAKIIAGDVLNIGPVRRALTRPIEALEAIQESPELRPSKAAESQVELHRILEAPGEVAGQVAETIKNPHFWAARLPEAAWSIGEYFLYGAGLGALAKKVMGLGKALKGGQTSEEAAQIAGKINKIYTRSGYAAAMGLEAAEAEANLRQWEKEHPDKPISWGRRVAVELGKGIVAGSLEAFSLERIFRGKNGQNLVHKVLDSIATEGTTEGAQEIVGNAFRKWGYDPDQKLTENVVEAVLVGAAMGGLSGAGVAAHRSARAIRERIATTVAGAKEEQAAVPEGREGFPIYRTGPTIQAGMAQPLAMEPARVTPPAPREEVLPGYEYVGRLPEEGRPPAITEPAPPGTPEILGPAGRPLRPADEFEAALAKQPWERNAYEKLLVERGLREGREALEGRPEAPRPPLVDQQGRPIRRPLPPAFGGPRPVVEPPLGVSGAEAAEQARKPEIPAPGAAEAAPPGAPPSPERAVPEPTKPAGPAPPMGVMGAEAAEQAAPETKRPPGMPVEAPKMEGPVITPTPEEPVKAPEAAPGLTTELIEQGRQVAAQQNGVAPEQLSYAGQMKDAGLLLYNIEDPEHPRYQSTVAYAVPGKMEAFLQQFEVPPGPTEEEGPVSAAPGTEEEYRQPYQMGKNEFLDSWEEEDEQGWFFSEVEGEPVANWRMDSQGRVTIQRGEDGPLLTNPETGEIYFDSPEAAKLEFHRQEVLQAHKAGKAVPLEVMEEYPETKQAELFREEPKRKAALPPGIAPPQKAVTVPEPSRAPYKRIAGVVKGFLDLTKDPITPQELFAWADRSYGGTQAEGKYTPKDAYDAMELGVNQYIQSKPEIFNPHADKPAKVIVKLEGLIARLPTQTRRTGESDEFQQFSTPPPLAYIVSWVANINQNDVVLEPSAGVGGLAVFAHNAGAKEVIVNELSPRRAELLREMGFDRVFTENAEQLNNILPKEVRPTVVVMNPPFSATAGRMLGKRMAQMGATHLEQALKRLEPGGRLVAIVGRGMAFDKPAFATWWAKIKKEYQVLANIGVSGKNYGKYGTNFDNQILVIDKTGPTTREPVVGAVEKLADLIPLLEGVKDERLRQVLAREREAQPGTAPEPVGEAGPEEGGRIRGTRPTARPATPGVGPGEREGERATPGRLAPEPVLPVALPEGDRGSHGQLEPGERHAGVRGERGGRRGASGEPHAGRPSGVGGGIGGPTGQPTGRGEIIPGSVRGPVRLEEKKAARPSGELTDAIYEPYQPQRLKVSGAQPHPGWLVQSAAMAAVEPPAPTYKPHLPKEVIDTGKLSESQLEAVVYAGQSHQDILPDGQRRGFFIGDGTGVGKGREIAGIIYDNWNQGRKKAAWISKSTALFKDARRDIEGVGWKPDLVFDLGKIKADSDIKNSQGILFTTYDTLKSAAQAPKGEEVKGKRRLDQIVEWLGEDFDGVVIFDESHEMGSGRSEKGARGYKKPSQKALAGMELQKKLPKARIVYVSATGATKVGNLAYAERLGLWGEGTPFPNREAFISEIESGGVAAMELVARDMKALGVYLARSLAFEVPSQPDQTVTYDRLVHNLTDHQVAIYNEMARAWQVVLQNIHEALRLTEGENSPQARAKAASQFWGSHQRFFNQVITSMQMPSVLEAIKKDLAEGNAVLVQLTNTLEAAQERGLARMADEEELDGLDLTPREALMQYVEHAFPTTQFEPYLDEEGNEKWRAVKDSQGNPVQNAEAVRMKEELLEKLGAIRVPDSPLDMLVNTFGPEAVAEATGRKRRLVKFGGETVLEKRGRAKVEADIGAFLSDKKQILVFSDMAGTGRSFNASYEFKNQRKRIHYGVQLGWRADMAVQKMGRSHRSNQRFAPHYVLVSTNLDGQKRFLSSIARRLDQLGALTKGQRQTGSTGLFQAKDNLEASHAKDALRQFYYELYRGEIPGMNIGTFMEQTGLRLLDKDGNLLQELPPITQFLNRLLSMEVQEQNRTFAAFAERLERAAEVAARRGTLDIGMETLRPDPGGRIEKISEQTVYTDPRTGAETKYVEVDEINPTKIREFEEAEKVGGSKPAFFKNVRSGRIWVREAKSWNDTSESGRVTQYWTLRGVLSRSVRDVEDYHFWDKSKWDLIKDRAIAKQMWQAEIAKAPKEQVERHHLIAGTILPIWDRLTGNTRVIRLQTREGERFIGRRIPERVIGQVLQNLGAKSTTAAKLTPQQVFTNILDSNYVVTLANGWEIKRSRVSGEDRIELKGPDFAHMEELRRAGVFAERIQWDTRFFIPTTEAGPGVIEKIIKHRPVVAATPRAISKARLTIQEDENLRRGAAAMERVISEQTDVPVAMRRDDLGDISFYWGEPGNPAKDFKGGYGVSHIIAKRNAEGEDGEAIARKMVEVIAKGEFRKESGPEGGQRVEIGFDKHIAILSKYRFGEREAWLLTGWREAAPGEPEKVYGSIRPTHKGPTRFRPSMGAGAEEIISPAGKKGKVPTVTKDTIQAAFGPRAKVTESALMPDVHEVTLPNGVRILVRQNADIQVAPEALAAYGKTELARGEVIAGEWRTINGTNLISLAKGEGAESLHHEVFHAAMELALTERERQAVLRKYGNEEAAARAYETWIPEKQPETLFQKILNFFRQIYRAFFPDAEAVFGKMRTGEVWGRKGRLPEGIAPRAKIKEAPGPQEVIDRFKREVVALDQEAARNWRERLKQGWEGFKGLTEDFYSQVVDRWAAWERVAQKAAQAGIAVPAGENVTYNLSFLRGVEGRVRQGISGDYVYHDTLEFDEKLDRLVFTGDAPEAVGPSLVKRLEPLKDLAQKRGESFAQVSGDLFHALMPAQRDLELAGETGVREPGEIKGTHPELSRAALAALKQKYSADYAVLEETAEAMREWGDQMILQPLLQVGFIDQARYEDIKAKNQFYVPFKRLLDDMETYISAHASAAGVKGRVIKKIKGSERQILDPLEMWMELAYKAQFAYARNKVYRGLYVTAQYAEMEDVKEIPAKFVPVDQTLKQEIDEKLRPQIEKLCQAIGVNVRMLYTLGGRVLGRFKAGMRREAGGAYGPEEREIEVRFATTEKVLSHELGHAIDHLANLEDLLINRGTPEMKRELRKIADQRIGEAQVSDYFRRYVRKKEEQVAEFVNRFLTDRETARTLAPNATAVFEKFLQGNEELKPLLDFKPTAQRQLREFYHKIWVRSPLPPEPGCLPYYRDGLMRWLKVPPDLYQAAVNMMPGDIGILMRVAKLPADTLRAGAILVPEFSLGRNPVRDIMQAWLFSRFGFNPAYWWRDTFKLLAKDEQAREFHRQWEAGGGELATLAQAFAKSNRVTADQILNPGKKIRYFAHPIQALRFASAYLENMTRFSIYKQAREKGLSHAEAIHEARRTTLDYSRVGGHPAVRYLGMIIPFFNASIQGIDKMASELAGPNRKAVLKRLTMLTAISLLVWAFASRDKRYKELEDWEKNYFWHLPLGEDGPMLRIPKPFEAGILFGSVPERMMEWALGQKPDMAATMKAVWEAAMPEVVPTIARPLLEMKANYDYFRGRPIEDVAMQRLPVSMRAKPWTTETAKAFSRHFGEPLGISPVMMEHFIRTLGGGLGANYFLPGVDLALRKAGVWEDIPKPAQDAIQQIWGVRAFFTRTPTGNRAKSVNDFFEHYQAAVQADQGWKVLWQQGKAGDLDKFLKEHPEAIFARVARLEMAQMGKLRKERDTIYAAKNLTPEEKQKKLDKIDAQLVVIARRANTFMDPAAAEKVGMPSRSLPGKGHKPIDAKQYYQVAAEATERAYRKLQPSFPRLSEMEAEERQRRIAGAIRTEREETARGLTAVSPRDLLKPFRPGALWDRPTKEEREQAFHIFGGFLKVPAPWMTGFRPSKEHQEARR